MKTKKLNVLLPTNKRNNLPDAVQVETIKIKTENNILGTAKILCWVSVLLLQIAAMVLLALFVIQIFQWYLLISFCLSVGTAIYVLSTDKSGNSKAVWMLVLLLFFYMGYYMYFISDENVCFSRHKKKFARIFERTKEYFPLGTNPPKNITADVLHDCNYLKNVGNFSTFCDTETKYFSSGALLFDDVIENFKKAKKFIFIEYFIIADGVLLNRMLEILGEKVKDGVDVRIIYDDLGSYKKLRWRTKRKMNEMGIKLSSFNRLVPTFSVAMNFRDHRKIIVIDGQISYTGGSNLADEYVNEKRIYGYWKDTGIRLDGDATDMLTFIFLRQWEFITGEIENFKPFLIAEKRKGEGVVIPYADGLDYVDDIGKNVYANVISQAQEKIYIMSPYFIVDETIENLLINKAKAGVDVRLVLPEIPDKKIVYIQSYNNALKLVKAGVKVYLMKDSFVHSKLLLTEDAVIVGSINMDMRSFYQQFESSVYTSANSVKSDVLKDFEFTFSESRMLTMEDATKRSVLRRAVVGVMRIFSPLM